LFCAGFEVHEDVSDLLLQVIHCL